MTMLAQDSRSHRSRNRRPTWEFRLLFVAMFPLFLISALLVRLCPMHWRSHARRPSIFGQARAYARSTLPFAFMG